MVRAGFWRRLREGYAGLALIWTGVCILFLVGNCVAVLLPEDRSERPPPPHVIEGLRHAYPGWSDAELVQLRRENWGGFVNDYLVQPREAPAEGRYVSVHPGGFRISREQGPWPPEERFYNVFLFGGSTTFGYGVPDDQTIASHLQELLARVGDQEVRVYNFGRGAYYSTQERIAFEKLLTLGYVPDLAVFIDGLNDFFHLRDPPLATALLTREADEGKGETLLALLQRLPLLRRLGGAFAPSTNLATREVDDDEGEERAATQKRRARRKAEAPRHDDRETLDAVIARYVANKAIIEAFGAAFGVEIAMVWQPVPLYRYDRSHHAYRGNFGRHAYSEFGYPRMAALSLEQPLGANFLWCADIQEGVAEALYVDWVHYTPDMSRRVARCIANLLVERRLVGDGE